MANVYPRGLNSPPPPPLLGYAGTDTRQGPAASHTSMVSEEPRTGRQRHTARIGGQVLPEKLIIVHAELPPQHEYQQNE